jgi:hypothetical protein
MILVSRYNLLASSSSPALRAAASGGRPGVGTDTTVTGEPASLCRIVVSRGEARATRSMTPAESGLAATLRVVPGANQYADSYLCALHVSRQVDQVVGVARHGLVQFAEGLLDAGVEVARTLGAVLACRCWFGRLLGQPCPGLVGDGAGPVALGQ